MGSIFSQSSEKEKESPTTMPDLPSDRPRTQISNKSRPCLIAKKHTQPFTFNTRPSINKMKIKRPIYFHENQNTRSKLQKQVYHALKRNKSLYSFCYDFWENLSDILPIMGKYYANLKNVRKAELTLSPIEYKENKEFESIGGWLKNFPHVVALDFISFQCNNLDKKGIHGLFKGIKSLRFLTKLSLTLEIPIILDEEGITPKENQVKALASQLGTLRSLKTLELNLINYQNIGNGVEYLSKALQLLDQLNNVSIILGFKQSYYQIKQVFSGLKSLKNLDTLRLRFYHVDFDDYQRDFPLNLQSFSKLKTLRLEISSSSQMNDEILADIASCLQRFSHLSSLSLSFRECEAISDKGFESICQAIKNMTEISFLCLNFSSCEKITNVGLLKLREAVKNLKLTSLSLLFNYSQEINNKSMEIIASVLQRLPKLSALSLDFKFNQQIDNDGIREISQTIEDLRYLSRLELDFSFNSKISDKGIRHLSKALSNPNLSSFDYISLRLNSSHKATITTKTELEEILKAISLEYILR